MEKSVIQPISPFSTRAGILLALLLSFGCLGNYFSLPLFFGADFIFGSIAVFIVLTFYGLGWGMLAAVIVNSFTYLLWAHPYAFFTFTLEALWVGYFLRSGRRNLVLLDGLFWLLLGLPLAYVFHALVLPFGPLTGCFIMLKQSVNGIFNALLASLAINHLPFKKFLEPGAPHRTASLRQTFLNLMMTAILLPALAIMMFNSREVVKGSQNDTVYHMELVAADIVGQLSLWHQQHLRALTQLADLAAKTSLEPSPALQHDTEITVKASSCFRAMTVANAQGTTIAFSPAVSQGQSNIGIDLADRRYFQEMQTTRRPVLSEVLLGRVSNSPVATLSVPIFRGEHFRGFALGVLDLQCIQKMLQLFGKQEYLHITLVDYTGRVITSTAPHWKPLMPWKPQDGDVQRIRDSVYQWFPKDHTQPSMARWKNSYYVWERLIPELDWKLVVEAPLAPLQQRLYLLYVRNLAIMAGLTVVGLLLAVLFTRWLVRPLAGLAQVTSNLPDKVLNDQEIFWPESSATEMHSLVTNFKAMARSLTASVQGLKAANIELTMEIAERTRVEAALRDSEERYRLLADNARDVIFRLDQNQQFAYLSPSVQFLTGFSPEEAMNLGLAGMLLPTSLQMALDTISQLQEIERQQKPALPPSATLELELLRQDGGTVWIEVQAAYLRDSQGQFAGFMGVSRDITDRRRAEAALLTERNKFKQVLETIPDGVYIVSSGYDIEYLNPVLEREFGPVAGRKCYQYLHDRSEPCPWCKNSEVFAGKSVRWEWQSTKTGKNFDLFDTPLVNADGSISKFEIFHDITVLKLIESELRTAGERLELALKGADLGTWDWNIKTGEVLFNARWAEMLGYRLDEIEAHVNTWEKLVHPDDLPTTLEVLNAHLAGETAFYETEHRLRHKSGNWVWVLDKGKVIERDAQGRPLRACGTHLEITARKQAEAEIIRQREELRGLAGRLAEVEETERQKLARELHDQVCQNLTSVSITLGTLILRAQKEPLDQLLSRVANLAAVVEQTSEITRNIMEGLRPTVLDHYGLMGGLRQFARQFSQRTGIAAEVRGEESAPRLAAPEELALFRITQEALANVTKHSKATKVAVCHEEKDNMFCLTIADNGIGFDPDKTTLPMAGHKWGLVTMAERAMAVGGECRIESQPGQGTRVIVEVPR